MSNQENNTIGYNIVTFPAKYLVGASLMCAQKDVRYYLNGIHLTRDRIASTDGHKLLKIDLTGSDEANPGITWDYSGELDLIIPFDAISVLLKQLTAKEKRESDVLLSWNGSNYQFNVNGKLSLFSAVAGRYPDIERVIPESKNLDNYTGPICFNWSYMATIEKVAQTVTGLKMIKVVLHPNNEMSAGSLVTFGKYDQFTVVIMPMRI